MPFEGRVSRHPENVGQKRGIKGSAPNSPSLPKLERVLKLGEKLFVFAVRTNPKPNHRPSAQHTNCAPIQIDADRVNWELIMNLLEAQRRMSWILPPKSICSLRFYLNRRRCSKKELTELLCGLRLHRA